MNPTRTYYTINKSPRKLRAEREKVSQQYRDQARSDKYATFTTTNKRNK